MYIRYIIYCDHRFKPNSVTIQQRPIASTPSRLREHTEESSSDLSEFFVADITGFAFVTHLNETRLDLFCPDISERNETRLSGVFEGELLDRGRGGHCRGRGRVRRGHDLLLRGHEVELD